MAARRLALVVPPSPIVSEIKQTDRDDFGNPGGVWHDVTGQAEVAAGWLFEDGAFKPPPPPEPITVPPAPALADLKRQLDALAAQIAQLSEHSS